MSRVSRRRFTLGATAALAAPALLPRESLGADIKIDFVHLWSGADHPVQKVIASLDSNLPVADVLTYDQLIGENNLSASFDATLLAINRVLRRV